MGWVVFELVSETCSGPVNPSRIGFTVGVWFICIDFIYNPNGLLLLATSRGERSWNGSAIHFSERSVSFGRKPLLRS
jgi:hypothetical protein